MFQPIRTYNLPPFSELRIVTEDYHSTVPMKPSIMLMNTINSSENFYEKGTAEIFGKELVPGVEVPLNEGERIAVYTWNGCTLQIKGSIQQEYESYDINTMKEYLNIINLLNIQRQLSNINNTLGPRVLVTGSPSSGKSSFCMILCNYAYRNNWTPIFIDADPRSSCDKHGIKLFPGTLGCVLYNNMDGNITNPLLYYYGYSYYQDNEFLYLHMMKLLNVNIELMLNNNVDNNLKSSGLIINAPYECNKDMIIKLCDMFKVTVVVVIDSPSIHQELIKYYKQSNTNINLNTMSNLAYNNIIINDNSTTGVDSEVKTENKEKDDMLILSSSKLEGVVSVDNNRLKYINNMNWSRYFEINNLGRNHVIKVNSNNITFIYIDIIEPLSKDALPTNEEFVVKNKEIYCNVYNDDLLLLNNLIVAVPATNDIKLIPFTNILSFFHIISIEHCKKTETAQAQQAGLDGNDLDEMEVDSYTISFCCQSYYSPSSLPKYLLLPRDFKNLKYTQHI